MYIVLCHFITCARSLKLSLQLRYRTIVSPQRSIAIHILTLPKPLVNPDSHWFVFHFYKFVILMESYSRWPFGVGFFSLSIMTLRFIQTVACVYNPFLSTAQYFMVWIYQVFSPLTHWIILRQLTVWGYYKQSCYEQSCIGFCMNMRFHCSGIKA